jgi:hypothetical protein
MKKSLGFAMVAGLWIALSAMQVWAGGPPNPTMSDATGDTAGGSGALFNLAASQGNTAFGSFALFANTAGIENTATGARALLNNTGALNTATGYEALFANTTGAANTAAGVQALFLNTAGFSNTATGVLALYGNTTGDDNTATGQQALMNNTVGNFNTGAGFQALISNTTGTSNTAAGLQALFSNTTGFNNTPTGVLALSSNTTGANNIALGVGAGSALTTGSNNIDIGNPGLVAETRTIRIGKQGTQTATYIAGIFNSSASGGAVEVSNTGKLGMVLSSARYKREIHDMGAASSNLMKLRPVTFRYKDDPQGIKQYGLVAEEVEQLYPELVIHDTAGKVQSVRYTVLTAMLLNELQKQTRENAQQAEQIEHLSTQVAQLKRMFVQAMGARRVTHLAAANSLDR